MPRSVATINQPEFINIKRYNPLISECEIKVLYVGENRNKSFISKEVAAEMANSLPGCPIVGYFREDKDDFADHGERVIIDSDGVKFEKLTRPYGFVAPDAQVWFQTFEEKDEFENIIIRDYLMTTGYLWTGQYEEVQRVIDEGYGQSMELDEKTLDGKWTMNYNSGIEFFIINDAIFSKLAILGKGVEPCFEGAEITAPKISSSFTYMDDEFKLTLFSMMQDLQSAIKSREGGLNMTEENLALENEKVVDDTSVEETFAEVPEIEFAAVSPNDGESKDAFMTRCTEAGNNPGQCAASWEQSEKEEPTENALVEEIEEKKLDLEAAVEETPPVEDLTSLETADFAKLKEDFEKLEEEVIKLREFKNDIEDKQKDALIAEFYMLSDEDKKDVLTNKADYSLDEIEAKLAVICVRNKVSFDRTEEIGCDEGEVAPAITFNLDDAVDTTPPIVQVLRDAKRD